MAFRPRRQARRNALIQAGFLPFEARALSELFMSSPVIKIAVKARRSRQRDWNKQKLSKAARRSDVKKLYTDNKWIIEDPKTQTRKGIVGQADPWGLFRAARQKAIDAGDYVPPKRLKKSKRGLDKEQVRRKQDVRGKEFTSSKSDREAERDEVLKRAAAVGRPGEYLFPLELGRLEAEQRRKRGGK